jgi:hypothetical protein
MNSANVSFCFGGVAALALTRANFALTRPGLPGAAVGTAALAAMGAYMRVRHLLIEQGRLKVDHLVGLAEGVGGYGRAVCDIDAPVLAEMDEGDLALLREEHEEADHFDPFSLQARARPSRNLLRYWVDRLRMEVKVVGQTHADACVLRHILQKMMRAKHYRTHQIAAMADTIVGLLQAGTSLHGIAPAVVKASHKRTWLEWAFRVPATAGRMGH